MLNEVIKNHVVKHLILIDTSIESFNYSLDVTDWPALFQDFEQRGGTIFLHIGEVTLEVKQRLAKHLNEIGPYNASTIHALNDGTDEGKQGVAHTVGCLQDCINSLGFYDDERVGLAHTMDKLVGQARFLRQSPKPWIDKPVVVCGNGPSLDDALPQIREHRDKMVLVACGSTFTALYRHA